MGKLRNRMRQDLELRGLAENTIKTYLRCARKFVAHVVATIDAEVTHRVGHHLDVDRTRQHQVYHALRQGVG